MKVQCMIFSVCFAHAVAYVITSALNINRLGVEDNVNNVAV